MDTLHLLSTAVTVIFIAATMFAAGLGTTLSALRGTIADLPLLMLALMANMVAVPWLTPQHRGSAAVGTSGSGPGVAW
jgi:bile acid:Na+ symporter, BASS family